MGLLISGSHFPKNSLYLVNGESDQKSVTNKRDAKLNFLSGVYIKFNVSYTRKVLFQFKKKLKKLIISKTVASIKKVNGTKKMENVILFQTCYTKIIVSLTNIV